MPIPTPVVVQQVDLGGGMVPVDIPGTVLQPRHATLGGLGFGAVDELGTQVLITDDIAGWESGPATTADSEQRASDHGAWMNPAFLAPRVIGLTLRLFGGNFATVSESISRIVGGVPLSELADFTVYNFGIIRTAKVRQEGEVLATQNGNQASVSVSLFAPDPRKYAVEESVDSTGLPQTSGGVKLPLSLPLSVGASVSSGVLTVSNDGNMATNPTFTVYGPCPPFTLTHLGTGKALRFNESLPAGRTLVIDTDRRRALLDGVAPRVVTGTWFDYAPGVNAVAFSAATYNAGARLVSSHRSAWR